LKKGTESSYKKGGRMKGELAGSFVLDASWLARRLALTVECKVSGRLRRT